MKLYNRIVVKMFVLFVLFVGNVVQAKVRTINTRRDFARSVAKGTMMVALFYDKKDKNLTRMYSDISNTKRYDDADVVFLKVNSASEDLEMLPALYGVKNMPALIFFNNGKRVANCEGAVVQSGAVSQDQLKALIDKYYGPEMDSYIAKKEARAQWMIEQEKASGYNWKEYFYPRTMNVPNYSPAERGFE